MRASMARPGFPHALMMMLESRAKTQSSEDVLSLSPVLYLVYLKFFLPFHVHIAFFSLLCSPLIHQDTNELSCSCQATTTSSKSALKSWTMTGLTPTSSCPPHYCPPSLCALCVRLNIHKTKICCVNVTLAQFLSSLSFTGSVF